MICDTVHNNHLFDRKTYHENGNLLAECSVHNGIIKGIVHIYQEDGSLLYELDVSGETIKQNFTYDGVKHSYHELAVALEESTKVVFPGRWL